ncbi:hypothetical protein HGRIS_011480 [Hohenbuehelia grisea]|uniref:Uncharacterized protein n=1 Tax=Hohenbuehelia grisea TaxID=104357 RepID=A0ABR3JV65_9AGAR
MTAESPYDRRTPPFWRHQSLKQRGSTAMIRSWDSLLGPLRSMVPGFVSTKLLLARINLIDVGFSRRTSPFYHATTFRGLVDLHRHESYPVGGWMVIVVAEKLLPVFAMRISADAQPICCISSCRILIPTTLF